MSLCKVIRGGIDGILTQLEWLTTYSSLRIARRSAQQGLLSSLALKIDESYLAIK